MDETSKQLLADVYEPLPMLPGRQARVDYEYQLEGVADLFMFFEPLAGKRYVKVTDQRTRKDWAEAMRELADVIYPHAKKIVVVLDNLNTHSPASFYETFEPEKPDDWLSVLSFTLPQNMVVGSIWRKLSWAS